MKKLLALILTLCLVFNFFACNKKNTGNESNDDTSNSQNTPPTAEPGKPSAIVVPVYKDYGRGSVNFDEVTYSRPNLATVIEKFDTVTGIIAENSISVTEQIEKISSLEGDFATVDTMYSIAEIYVYKDASDSFWKSEYKYISTNYPLYTQAVENLLVACAKSEHKTTFENDYFGYSLNEYVDGGIYTDRVVELMSEEARIENEYSSLSTDTVEIVYSSLDGTRWEGTLSEVYAMAAEKYGINSREYSNVCIAIDQVYEQKLKSLQKPMYIELVKVRRLIANELGYSSYSYIAYDNMGYDYTPNQMIDMLSDIGLYVTPVASNLEYATFQSYFQKNRQPLVGREELINTLYNLYSKTDPELSDAYSYMLQHGLYDINTAKDNRYDGAFTTYLDLNNSPFIFMTTTGFAKDYLTLAHEFGHFADGYFNYGDSASLDLSEISSQGLELLSVLALKKNLNAERFQYLEYYTMYSMLNNVLLAQSFIALFEHLVYELEYSRITEDNLETVLINAFETIYGTVPTEGLSLSVAVIPHTVCYPFYVESYVSSALVALELFFMESYVTGKSGNGLEVYMDLIKRENSDVTLTEALESVGLTSPFTEGQVKKIANNIYYQIIGKNYYNSYNDQAGAA